MLANVIVKILKNCFMLLLLDYGLVIKAYFGNSAHLYWTNSYC